MSAARRWRWSAPTARARPRCCASISGLIAAARGPHHLRGRRRWPAGPRTRSWPTASPTCPEGRRLFPALTVAENLKMGAFLPAARAHYRESLERVYALFPVLAERRRQRAGSLSGGEQQMLAIGRALMSRPRLILLDEPSMGLAPVMVLRLFDLIRRVRERGLHHPGRGAERASGAQARRPRVPAGGGTHQDGGPRRRAGRAGLRAKGVRRALVIDPIFLAEAAINGILLGGILALLALGLNLIFGVIDIVWIAYVDLVMLCMYLVYFLVQVYGWPVWLAALASIALGAAARRARAPADHHADPRQRADQPAAGHRRPALLHPVLRHASCGRPITAPSACRCRASSSAASSCRSPG